MAVFFFWFLLLPAGYRQTFNDWMSATQISEIPSQRTTRRIIRTKMCCGLTGVLDDSSILPRKKKQKQKVNKKVTWFCTRKVDGVRFWLLVLLFIFSICIYFVWPKLYSEYDAVNAFGTLNNPTAYLTSTFVVHVQTAKNDFCFLSRNRSIFREY